MNPSDLQGWTIKPLADGALYVPPGGRDAGAIRLQRQLRPIISVKDAILPDVQKARALLDDLSLAPAQRLVTSEGELAAVVTMRGTNRQGARTPVERTVGLVFGDDYYQRFDGLAMTPAIFTEMQEAVRTLVVTTSLGLGERRCRRFAYAPPAGWQGRSVGLAAEWFPLEYPRQDATITVLPAGPPQAAAALGLRARRPPGFVIQHEWAAVPSSHGLTGRAWCALGPGAGGRPQVHEVVEMQDGENAYCLVLTCAADAYVRHHETLVTMARSVEPLPRPVLASSVDLMTHWVA